MRYVLIRRSDGLYWAQSGWCKKNWTDKLDEALIFKTPGACKRSANPFLYEKNENWKSWSDGQPYIKHPEWFDQKFEIKPVEIRPAGDADALLESCYNFLVELPEGALRNEMYDEMESLAGQIRRFRDG